MSLEDVAASIGYTIIALAASTAIKAKTIMKIGWPTAIRSMLMPRYRKAAELAKNAIISEKLNANVLIPVLRSIIIVYLTKLSEAFTYW